MAYRVLRVPKDRLACRAPKALKGSLDRKDFRVLKAVCRGLRGLKETRDQ